MQRNWDSATSRLHTLLAIKHKAETKTIGKAIKHKAETKTNWKKSYTQKKKVCVIRKLVLDQPSIEMTLHGACSLLKDRNEKNATHFWGVGLFYFWKSGALPLLTFKRRASTEHISSF